MFAQQPGMQSMQGGAMFAQQPGMQSMQGGAMYMQQPGMQSMQGGAMFSPIPGMQSWAGSAQAPSTTFPATSMYPQPVQPAYAAIQIESSTPISAHRIVHLSKQDAEAQLMQVIILSACPPVCCACVTCLSACPPVCCACVEAGLP